MEIGCQWPENGRAMESKELLSRLLFIETFFKIVIKMFRRFLWKNELPAYIVIFFMYKEDRQIKELFILELQQDSSSN